MLSLDFFLFVSEFLIMSLKKNFPLLKLHGRGSRQLGVSRGGSPRRAAGGLNMIGIIWQKRKS